MGRPAIQARTSLLPHLHGLDLGCVTLGMPHDQRAVRRHKKRPTWHPGAPCRLKSPRGDTITIEVENGSAFDGRSGAMTCRSRSTVSVPSRDGDRRHALRCDGRSDEAAPGCCSADRYSRPIRSSAAPTGRIVRSAFRAWKFSAWQTRQRLVSKRCAITSTVSPC